MLLEGVDLAKVEVGGVGMRVMIWVAEDAFVLAS